MQESNFWILLTEVGKPTHGWDPEVSKHKKVCWGGGSLLPDSGCNVTGCRVPFPQLCLSCWGGLYPQAVSETSFFPQAAFSRYIVKAERKVSSTLPPPLNNAWSFRRPQSTHNAPVLFYNTLVYVFDPLTYSFLLLSQFCPHFFILPTWLLCSHHFHGHRRKCVFSSSSLKEVLTRPVGEGLLPV